MRKQFFKEALLAVALAAFSSTAAMGESTTSAEPEQEQGKKSELDWLKDISDRIELHTHREASTTPIRMVMTKEPLNSSASSSGQTPKSLTDGRFCLCTTFQA